MKTLPPRRPGSSVNRPADGFWGLLNETDQAALLKLGSHRTFAPRSNLCTELDRETHVFILLSGLVKVTRRIDDHREQVLALRGNGDVVGERAAGSDGFRTATIQAIAPVRALVLANSEFSSFLDDHPGAGRAYRQAIIARSGESDERLPNRSVSSGPQRLAAVLIDLAERYGTQGKGGRVDTVPLSQKDIASYIGVSRATVTRALGDWRERGLISTSRLCITIINISRLRRIARKDLGPPTQPATS